jgi:hypothetical protein
MSNIATKCEYLSSLLFHYYDSFLANKYGHKAHCTMWVILKIQIIWGIAVSVSGGAEFDIAVTSQFWVTETNWMIIYISTGLRATASVQYRTGHALSVDRCFVHDYVDVSQ